MTIGVWTPAESRADVPADWQRIAALGREPVDRLIVHVSDWTSFAEATEEQGLPSASVILVRPSPDDEPAGASELVDAFVSLDELESAIRITDIELADLAASLDDRALTRLALATTAPDPFVVGGVSLAGADRARGARASLYEASARAQSARPLRALLGIEAPIPQRPDERLAAAAIVALLAAGMRAVGRRQLRGEPDPPLPSERAVAEALLQPTPLRAVAAGRVVDLSLEGEHLVLRADAPLSASLSSSHGAPWRAAGREVRVPLARLSGATLRLDAADSDEAADV